MSYNSDFEQAFIERSLRLLHEYPGKFEATLLLNCLLGLVIVPRATCLKAIPVDPIGDVRKWGIPPSAIDCYGQFNGPDDDPHNVRGLVWRLRNAVAHFHFEPRPAQSEVEAFHFHDKSGFAATIKVGELRAFVERLAALLKEL